MKKALFIAALIFTGCLNTSTKTDLARPDFSHAKVCEVSEEPCCGCVCALTTEQHICAIISEIQDIWQVKDYLSVREDKLIAELNSLALAGVTSR